MPSAQQPHPLADSVLTAAAAAFLVAYAAPILNPELSPGWQLTCSLTTWATWLLFAAEYVFRVLRAEDRRRYVLRHWFDLAVIALPLLRPLRLLRLVTALQLINRRASTNLRGRIAIYMAGGSALLAFCASLATLDAERDAPGATITGFGDALWWSLTTMTTVGYGDLYPVTATGRVVAAALMVGGIAILGVVTATLATWLVEYIGDTEEKHSDQLRAQLAELNAKVDALIEQKHGDSGARTEPDRAVYSAEGS